MQMLPSVVDIEDLDHFVRPPRHKARALPDPWPAIAHEHDPAGLLPFTPHGVHAHAQAVEEAVGILQPGGVDTRSEGEAYLVIAQFELGPEATGHPDLHLAPLAARVDATAIRPHQPGGSVVGQRGLCRRLAGAVS